MRVHTMNFIGSYTVTARVNQIACRKRVCIFQVYHGSNLQDFSPYTSKTNIMYRCQLCLQVGTVSSGSKQGNIYSPSCTFLLQYYYTIIQMLPSFQEIYHEKSVITDHLQYHNLDLTTYSSIYHPSTSSVYQDNYLNRYLAIYSIIMIYQTAPVFLGINLKANIYHML